MFDWILNTPLVNVVRTEICIIIFFANERNCVPANKQINKQITGKNKINYHSSQIIQAIFWNLIFFVSWLLYISDIALQKLSLFSNSEVNTPVTSWSSFYVLNNICAREPFADIIKIGVLKTWRPSTLLNRDSDAGFFQWILGNF